MAAESVTVSQKDTLPQTEKSEPVSPEPVPTGVARPMAAEIPNEMERRFNNLRREFLDLEVQAVHRWLTALAIFLAVMGVLVPIAAYIGFRRFFEIEREAQAILKEIRGHEQDAQQRVDQIGVTAEDVEKNEAVLKEALAATKAPDANLIDIAVTEALTLQQNGRIKEAIEKWEAIANLVENTDRNQAARAYFSVGYLYSNYGTKIHNGSTSEDANKRAVSSFNEAIRLQPNHVSAYLSRGASKVELGQYEAAIADFDEAIRLQPDYASAFHNRGVSKAELEQHAAAIVDLDEAIRLRPDYVDSFNSRGLSKIGLEQYKDAIADFDEAIRLQPDHWYAYYGRGHSKSELGQYVDAIADLDKAIRLQPDHAASYYARGFSKGRLKEYEIAIADLDEAIRLRPDYAQAFVGRGAVKAELKQYKSAVADLDEAIRLQPSYVDAYSVRGATKGELGQHQSAIADLDEVIRLQPDNVGGYEMRAQLKAALGQDVDAASDRSQAARLATETGRPDKPSA